MEKCLVGFGGLFGGKDVLRNIVDQITAYNAVITPNAGINVVWFLGAVMKQSSKELLDRLLEEYMAQPVGTGYIDVIVSRNNYQSSAKSLIDYGYQIDAVSWWEYLPSRDMNNSYGMGGPLSRFYPGWFAETCTEIDEIQSSGDAGSDLNALISLIENKVLGVYDGKQINFQETQSLTPAFWLNVDKSWKNIQ